MNPVFVHVNPLHHLKWDSSALPWLIFPDIIWTPGPVLFPPPLYFLVNVNDSDCSQAGGELRDGGGGVYPSQCSLHALPGLQREARHAAGKRRQLWEGN